MKKKIILILPTAGGGGSEKVLINFANLLSNNFIVTLCFLNLEKIDYLNLINKKIKIINLDKTNFRNSFFQLSNIIKLNKYEYVFSSIFHINIVSILIKIFTKNKFKLIIRETNKIFNKRKDFIKFFLIFIFYRFANLIISPSNLINKELENFLINKRKIKLLNNPVLINKNNKLTKYQKKINFFLNRFKYIIILTRLEKHKNIEFLINCVAEANNTENLKLLIIGDGSQKKNLINKIRYKRLQNKVKIINFTSNPFHFLKKSNLYFNCSYYEGQSNAVLEALYFNIPVISAKNGSHINFIKKYSFGHVFNKFDVSKVTKKILKIINEKPKKISSKFYEEIDGTNIINKFIKLINNIY